MKKITVNNPVMDFFLAKIRDKNSGTFECCSSVEIVSYFLAGEVSKGFHLRNTTIQTPLGEKECAIIDEKIVLVPVLRAGIAMLNAFQRVFPMAKTAFIWAHRNKDAKAVIDKYKFPCNETGGNDIQDKVVVILDPMLATAGTANACCDLIYNNKPKKIILVSIFSTQIGMKKISKKFDAVITASTEDTLDERNYVYPGVGDAGDRLFG